MVDKRSKNRGHSYNNRLTTQSDQQGVVDKQVEISNMQRRLSKHTSKPYCPTNNTSEVST
ncbi:11780_t:CDS:2 [Acaulospora morrowiae]|uniref:11780_t:CDS:1 n=1 Tax=Acaulospora morrowiae TaxID=94023 RepID=A0A9N9DJB8_9GLOM|nr:11780_t:CDS:2 [Acaulospora morrowiae]